MLSELVDVTPKWYYIGLQLGLKDRDLDPIQSQNSDPLNCTCEMVKQWLTHPTWNDLVDALSSPLVREEYQANRLRLKYCETGNRPKGRGSTLFRGRALLHETTVMICNANFPLH